MKIGVASEHRGFSAKAKILSQVTELEHEALDFGPSNSDTCDYPDYGTKAAQAVSSGNVDRAILIGGTGIGMSILANKFRRVRAAVCYDEVSAEMSRRHNDANVLCLSADLLNEELASRMVQVWLSTPFDGGHHARRIAKIDHYEDEIKSRGHSATSQT